MPAVRDSKSKPKAKPQAAPKKAVKVVASPKGRKVASPPKKSAKPPTTANASAKNSKTAVKSLAAKPAPKAGPKPAGDRSSKPVKGTAIIVRQLPNTAMKPSQLPERPKLAQGQGANGILAGKMGKNGMAAVMANGKPISGKLKNGATTPKREIVLPADYVPSDGEPFMNEMHRVYFRKKLLAWKEEILRQNMETLKGLHDESAQQADPADRATAETDRALELRARDRQRKLMGKIDAALARIEEGHYGYCEETGEPISLKRLDARPIATLSLEAQERRERRERVFRED